FNKTNAQVNITKPNLAISVCTFPSAYNTLGQIQIEESANANFTANAASQTLILTAPANFEFRPGFGALTVRNGRDITVSTATMVVTATTMTITYTCTTIGAIDRLRIDGLQIRAINVVSTGNITRTGGTGVINGLINTTTLTNTLTSTLTTISTLATTPIPANGATGVCFAGGSGVSDLSWTAAAGAVSYDVYFGTVPVPVFTTNVTGTTYIPPTLLPSTTYYWKIVPVGPCGVSTGVPIVWSFTTAAVACYCIPTSTGNTYPISNVTFAGINNSTSGIVTVGPYYQNFSGTSGNVVLGGTYLFSATATGVSPNLFGIYVFFDWNNNGFFSDDGPPVTIGTYTTTASGLLSANITVPVTATVGTIRMRVSNNFNSVPSSCPTAGSFQDEDYSLNITTPACTGAPTAQPTGLVLTPVGQSIGGSFTFPVPAANQYLVVISTSAIAPTPVNGTVYNIGDSVGAGYTVVDNDSNNTFNAGALNLSTTYYIYIYSFNSFCPGSPLYLTVAPLTGNATTAAVPATYCTPVTTSLPINRLYVSRVEFVGTLLDTANISTTDGVPDGFQDFTGLATKSIQAQGGPINMKLTSAAGRGFWKVWVDWNKDGDFVDAGEEIYNPFGFIFISTTFGFVVPSTAIPGDYRMRIRVQNTYRNSDSQEALVNFGSCNPFGAVTVGGQAHRTYGEAEDYLFTVIPKCNSNITSITNPAICGNATGTVTATISATSTSGTINWYTALTGGLPIGNTASGTNWTTPAISTSNFNQHYLLCNSFRFV
ncbi:GEVED domain-containing protein, partial [Flavobacterium sp.]|uniref:immunoglobulin domain-containing protein n=1 Tax=Flavobacterium sp. TaxID=239 RepID=UPI00374DB0C3